MNKWTIEENNDTGPNDEYYKVWWEVTNGTKTYRCDKLEDAEWLLTVLNDLEE